jgi:hypothetical protein
MDGNRELEQLDAEARALKATLMRYMSEALIEDQGLNKLTAELTKIVQASQRHAVDAATRAEQRMQALSTTVESVRGELREIRTLVNDQASKRKKTLDMDVLTEQLDRLQLEVRKLATGLQLKEARGASATEAGPPRRAQPRAPGSRRTAGLPVWQFAAPLSALLVISIGYNVWQATRSSAPLAEVAAPPKGVAKPLTPAVQMPSAVIQPAFANVAAVALPDPKQEAWNKIWRAALELPLQQCWPDTKSNAKVSKFRDCACVVSDKTQAEKNPSDKDRPDKDRPDKDRPDKDKVDKEVACEVTSKWSAEASLAALQAVLSVAAAKPITIDAKVGAGTFSAIDLVIKDCGFKDAGLTRAIEELRTTRGKPAGEGKEPPAQQILGFLQKNLHSCR